MIINSTGNNFGAGQIEFKAALDANYVILNGRVPLDRSAPEYVDADILEIYVPELPMKRSMETAVFMTFTSSYDSCITIVKSWIKNRNTICLEKLKMSDNFNDFELVFYCAYLPMGQRETFCIEDQIDLSIENLPAKMFSDNYCAIVREKWAFICIGLENLGTVEANTAFSFDLVNFPKSITAEVPLLAPMGYAQGWADSMLPSRIEDGRFLCDGYTTAQDPQISCGFIKAFIVIE